jgi:hypothetical protein
MRSIEIAGSRIAAILLAVAVVSFAYVVDKGLVGERATALAGQDPAIERSSRASQAEADIARTNLAGQMTTALGDAFGGVWFEPSSAQLHVGTISAASARLVETVAARAGLSEIVTVTPVTSTWAQLEAVQREWNGRLVDLFARGEVSTALVPDTNSVQITLGPSVSAARQGELASTATAAATEVSIDARTQPFSRGGKGAQCAKFGEFAAFCDPTIVAGVSFDGEKNAQGKRQTCTAGPTAILVNRDQKEAATQTYVLTAGHCIEGGGGEGKKWYAYNKEGEPKGENEVGTAGPFLNAETDVGAVLIDKSKNYWAKDKDPIPVIPKVALWDTTEHNPTVVKKQIPPVKNAKTCLSGERSGKVCGTIENANMTYKFPGEPVATERLVEVKLAGGKTGGKGDSGGPFYSEATPSSLEGTFVGFSGKNEEEGPIVYFHSLETSFATLAKEKAFTLELLTDANEKRHGKLKAGKYPVTIHGSTTAVHKFTAGEATIECKENTYHAVLSAESSTLTVAPTYQKCTALGVAATVEMEGCTYVLHASEKLSTDNYRAYSDISCPAGKSMKFSVPLVGCKLEVKSQNALEKIEVTDDTAASPKKDVTAEPTLKNIAYTVTQDGAFCPLEGLGEKTNAEHSVAEALTVTGQSTTEPAEKIDIEVVD